MKPLSAYAIKQIDAYDYRAFRRHKERNRTRLYIYLTRAGNDVEVRTVAVKSRKDGTACVKEVIRASVDDKNMYGLDIVYGTMYGYSIDWSNEKLGAKHEWNYRGAWNDMPYIARDVMFKPDKHVINIDLLKRVRRFKYCQYNHGCGRILDYLKLYVKHPRIEMLVKMGLERFVRLPGFVKQLEADKAFMRFFMQNIPQIKRQCYATDVIKKAYAEKLTLSEASEKIFYMRLFGGYLPGGIDERKAHDYIEAQKVPATWYRDYLDKCLLFEMDIADTKVSFPKRLKQRMKFMDSLVDEARRREDAERQKKMDNAIAAMAKKLSKLEAVSGPFRVVVPKREKDFRTEGRRLNHCIGQGCYAAGYASGAHVIAFIRRARACNVPFVTLKFLPSTGKVEQCYGKNNSKPEKRVLDFVHGAFTRAAKRISKEI